MAQIIKKATKFKFRTFFFFANCGNILTYKMITVFPLGGVRALYYYMFC